MGWGDAVLHVGEELGQDLRPIPSGWWADEDPDGEATEEGGIAILRSVGGGNDDDSHLGLALAAFLR